MSDRWTADAFVMVDWSAASRQGPSDGGTNGLWAAIGEPGAEDRVLPFRTRTAAARWMEEELRRLTHDGRRVLCGIDAAFGYPSGTAAALGLPAAEDPWTWMRTLLADLITDDERNVNNRYAVADELNARMGAEEGPFWGRPETQPLPHLHPTKPTYPVATPHAWPLAELRHTERHWRDRGHHPKSVWQVAYNGSVGGQTLVALPVIHRLRQAFAEEELLVWPFDTGYNTGRFPSPGVVVAEVYPSLLPHDPALHPVRDAAQVLALVRAYRRMATDGSLLTAIGPPDLNVTAITATVREEGWILPVIGA